MRSKYSLLFLFLLSFYIPTMAQDEVRLRGCRRGIPRPQTESRCISRVASLSGKDYYKGNRHQLLVLVAFADRSFKDDETTTMAVWDKIFNTENLTEAPYKGSVRDYFFAQSYSQLNLTFDLQFVQLSENCEKYRSWLWGC